MTNTIYLVQCCKDSRRNGGCASFTEHLHKGLVAGGYSVEVCRVLLRCKSGQTGVFGQDLQFTNYDLFDFQERVSRNPGPVLICINDGGSDVCDALMESGAFFVWHDYRSRQDMLFPLAKAQQRIICIRETGVRSYFPNATFIPHPYMPLTDRLTMPIQHDSFCISHTRIDFDKRTHVLVAANQLLPPDQQIDIFGRENRMYSKWKLQEIDPDWDIGGHEFPRGPYAPVFLAARAPYNIDLTLIKGDGCGSQYSFMEAMDAGAIPIHASDWGHVDWDGIEVEPTPEAVADLLSSFAKQPDATLIQSSNRRYLREVHDAVHIGHRYADVLGVTL